MKAKYSDLLDRIIVSLHDGASCLIKENILITPDPNNKTKIIFSDMHLNKKIYHINGELDCKNVLLYRNSIIFCHEEYQESLEFQYLRGDRSPNPSNWEPKSINHFLETMTYQPRRIQNEHRSNLYDYIHKFIFYESKSKIKN